jgi:hypothetical protein
MVAGKSVVEYFSALHCKTSSFGDSHRLAEIASLGVSFFIKRQQIERAATPV